MRITAGPTTAGGLLAGAEVDPPFPRQIPKPIPMPEGGGHRNGNPLYALTNAKGTYHFIEQAPVRVSALRGLGAQMNVFAIECFMDELAKSAGADPLAFRLAHMKDARARDDHADRGRSLRLGVTRKGGRRPGLRLCLRPLQEPRAYCAVAMEVVVDRASGDIKIPRVVAAVDSGEAVNPDGIRNQIEGGIVQSLSWTIHEAVAFDTTHRSSFDWSAYPIVRFDAVPATVEVHVIDRPGQPFLGTGEAAQGPPLRPWRTP